MPARVQGWLGVRTLGSRSYGRGEQPGLIVLSVAAGSPAAQAGLRPTDILHAIDQHVLRRPADVVAALAGREADQFARTGSSACRSLVAECSSRSARGRPGWSGPGLDQSRPDCGRADVDLKPDKCRKAPYL